MFAQRSTSVERVGRMIRRHTRPARIGLMCRQEAEYFGKRDGRLNKEVKEVYEDDDCKGFTSRALCDGCGCDSDCGFRTEIRK